MRSVFIPLLLFLLFSCGRRGYPPGKPEVEGPEIKIISPSEGDTLKDTVFVKVEAKDPSGVGFVSLFVDQKEVGRDSSPPYEIRWDTSTFPDTIHIIVVKGQDKWDNWGESEKIKVYTENERREKIEKNKENHNR
jgi:hypothetical protein